MADERERLLIEMKADVRSYEAAMRRAYNQTQRNAARIEARFAQMNKKLDSGVVAMSRNMVSAFALIGGAAAVGRGINVLADFGQAMSTVGAVSKASAADLARMEATARNLGATTRFSATQAAEGMLFLARAGFKTDEILASIEGTLQLAQAGNLDLGRAADIASNTLAGFNLNADQTQRVVDVLAAAANNANTDVEQLGEALKFAAPTATELGLGLEETVAIIGKLSDAGLQAGLAGRGFQSFATKLIDSRAEIEALIGPFDLAEEGLANVVRRLDKAGITTAQVIKMFRAENLDVFGILKNAALDAEGGIDALNGTLDTAAGEAGRVARIMDENLKGAILATLSRLQELILALGEAGATDALITGLEGLQGLLTMLAENADILSVAIIALSVRALLPFAQAAGKDAVRACLRMQAQLVALHAISGRSVTVIGLLTGSVRGLAAAMGPFTIAIAAAAAAWVAFGRDTADAGEHLGDFADNMSRVRDLRSEISSDLGALKDANDKLTDAIKSQGEAAQEAARLEIDAVNRRIAKNRELARTYEALARADLASAERDLDSERGSAERDASNRYAKRERVERGMYSRTGPTGAVALERARAEIFAKQDRGEALTEGDTELLEKIARISELEGQAKAAREALDALAAGGGKAGGNLGGDMRGIEGDPVTTVTSDGDGEGGDLAARQARVIAEIDEAWRGFHESERARLGRERDARLEAIDAAGIKGAEADAARAKAQEIYKAGLKELAKAEAETAAERLAEIAARETAEADLMAEIIDRRDRAQGHFIELARREFEARREEARRTFEEEAELKRALKAIDAEEGAFEEDVRASLPGETDNRRGAEDEISRIQEDKAAELEALREAFDAEIILIEEYEARKRNIIAESEREIRDIRLAEWQVTMGAAESTFGTLADMAKQHAGESSGIYKALFAMKKGFAIAETTINTARAVSEALASAPPPINFIQAAAVGAAGAAQVASIASTGFRGGGWTGAGRDDEEAGVVHKNEIVFDAPAVRRIGRNELEALRLGRVSLDGKRSGAAVPAPIRAPALPPAPMAADFGGAGGLSMSFTGGPISIGSADNEGLGRLEQMLIADRASRAAEMRAAIADWQRRNLPRHQRG